MTWKELEEKYQIKFTLENGDFRPVNEWLDDIYLTFAKLDVKVMMEDIMNHGSELFADLIEHKK